MTNLNDLPEFLISSAGLSDDCASKWGLKLIVFKPASNFVLLIVPSRYFCSGSFCFMSWCLKVFVLLAPYVCFHIFS